MSVAAPPSPLLGVQTPRLLVRPSGAVSSAAAEVIDLAASCGLILDDWQRLCLDVILSEDAGGRQAAMTAALIVPRQNGKGSVIEALELGWLFLFEVPLILHSAHLFKTSQDAFKRLLVNIRNNPDLMDEVAHISYAHGKEGVQLRSGAQINFIARSKGGGRGFSCDRLVLDEAYDLPDLELDAAMPTLSARPDFQMLVTSSAPMSDSVTLRRIRARLLAGDGDAFAGLEWSVDPADYDPQSEAAVAQANPAYGIRITARAVANERATMSEAGFARERLGVPDEATSGAAFDLAAFSAAESDDAAPGARVVFGVDCSPDGVDAAIFACDGAVVEVVDVRPGIGWVAARLADLVRTHRGDAILDPAGPAGALVPHLAPALGKRLRLAGARDKAQACGAFDTALRDGTVKIRRSAVLRAAVESSRRKRAASDAWVLRRAEGGVSIAPAWAAVLAHWGATSKPSGSLADQVF